MAMTVNGIIAKENDETPWSNPVWKNYYRIAKSFKAIILGRRTFAIMKDVNEFDKIGNPFVAVVGHENAHVHSNSSFVKSPQAALQLLKKKKFSKVLLGGGSKVNAAFMKEGLVDEIYLDVEPLLFGKGFRLFTDEAFERKLKLIGIRKLAKDIIELHYKVRK